MTEATEATKATPTQPGGAKPGPAQPGGAKTGAARPGAARPDAAKTGAARSGGPTKPGATATVRRPAPRVGDAIDGVPDVSAPAHDGESAGLARIALAMREARKQPPAPSRLVALCSWATAIGIAGLLLAARSGLALLTSPPPWFLPSSTVAGLVGVACTAAAFLTARQRVVPWALLGVASCAIGASVLLISLLGAAPTLSDIP